MPHIFSICTENKKTGIAEAIAEIAAEAGIAFEVKEWRCLSNCHRCYKAPFVLIDDQWLISADSLADVSSKIMEWIKTEALLHGEKGDA